MNKKTIDIILKIAFIIGCAGLGLKASNLINEYNADKSAKDDVFDQFVDICMRSDDVEGVWW